MTNARLRKLLSLLDAHAPGEAAHGERVAVYSVAIGERIGLDDSALLDLRFAAALHDAGKLLLPRELLLSTTGLSETELKQIRTHPVMASKAIEGLNPHQLQIIESHHESWDGSGYPRGLSGAAIPLGSRIVALCEMYDVVSFGNHWRAPLTEIEAIEMIHLEAGKTLDPALVAPFVAIQPIVQPIGL